MDCPALLRKLVDEAARRRGGAKLLLGARVPQNMEECTALGFDVKAWVQKGLVDYINPSHFAVTDYNMRTEDFVTLTKGTQCRVYPSVHHPQYVDFCLARGRETPVHSGESYRAAAKSYYAYGADGIGSLPFRMAEDLNDAHLSATLEFKVTGMAGGDQIEVNLNGTPIPANRIDRRHYAELEAAFHLYRMPLSSPPAKSGDNELRLRRTKSAGTGQLVAQEIEVLVRDSRP